MRKARGTSTFAARALHEVPGQARRIYSALGGIPYYLDALDVALSPTENLYNLLVHKDGLLRADTEYEQLFRYLFSDDPMYMRTVDELVKNKYGVSSQEIARAVERKKTPSGSLSRVLRNLEYSDLIAKRSPFLNRSKGLRYFVTDEYIRFVSCWLKGSGVTCFRDRRQAIADLLKAKRKAHHYINYCFIVRNGIKRNRYFQQIEPLVVDLSRVL